MEEISKYFEGVAWKYLRAVDANPVISNQHELGGLVNAGFKQYLGQPGHEVNRFQANYIYLSDNEDDSTYAQGTASWYDCRLNQPDRRPELRLYYDSNPVTDQLKEGMFLLVAKRENGELLLIFTDKDSSAEQQLRWLFGIEASRKQFKGKKLEPGHQRMGWSASWILENIGIEPYVDGGQWLEKILSQFGEKFPKTKKFADFAADSIEHLDLIGDPDEALILLTEREEMLFKILEKHLVQKRLDEGFNEVEDFISYSLSVHNTRKSRAGHSFENHLARIFDAHELPYSRGAFTEGRSKPDFLFPNSSAYNDPNFNTDLLNMLGVKTTCKDRWRQVLREAERIPEKHLATLEPGISEHQTNEMRDSGLRLVVPEDLHETYKDNQKSWLLTLSDFIEYRKAK